MKRFFFILLALVGFVVVAVGSTAGFFAVRGVPTYDAPTLPSITVAITPQQVKRGYDIAAMECIACHRNPQTTRLTGRPLPEMPPEFGSVASANITQDKTHGIGSWTDGELIYFLRTGVRKDGRYAPPYMPKFPLMADQDMQAVVAWLRSPDNAMAQADPTPTKPNEATFLIKALCNTVIKPLPYPTQAITVPDSTDLIAFGRYTADGVAHCYGCHSADFKKQDELHPEKSEGFYGGGNLMMDNNNQPIYTANLTMDEETGLANKYTEESFVKAVRFGQGANGPLRYPMFPHSTLTDHEVRAIWAYLQTVPKLKNNVTPTGA